jgi:starch phosphorylase
MHPDLEDYGPIRFHSDPNALYERHLIFDYAIDPDLATPRERYEAVARSLRDVLALRWMRTKKTHYSVDPKHAYYFSMEFLTGRSLASNVSNLLLDPAMLEACREKNVDWYELLGQEPDAGLGNGGLGRLAACFIESMATLDLPAMGYGLRYEYEILKQLIHDGWQNEKPDSWLRRPDPWEVVRLDHIVEVKLNCSFEIRGKALLTSPISPPHC